MKYKLAIVRNCGDCNCAGGDVCSESPFCVITGKKITNSLSIPDDCPLQDIEIKSKENEDSSSSGIKYREEMKKAADESLKRPPRKLPSARMPDLTEEDLVEMIIK